jgi:hypothetical protein
MVKAQQSWVKHRDTPKYKEGDQVWLEGKNLRINQPTAKLAPRRHGPFKITQVMSAVNYRLELPTQWSIHPVFHINLLTPYKETIMHGPNFTRPAPELIDGEEEYSVEKILDSRRFGRRQRLQYLVKWEGYPDLDNMWVDKDDVFAEDKVREFKASNPEAETHIRTSTVAKSHHPHPLTRSQLLHNHALHYMSSDGNDDLAQEYTARAAADSPIPFSQEFPINTPVIIHSPVPIVDFATLRALSPIAPTFVPRPVTASSSASDVAAMFCQLRVHTPAPLTPDGQRAAEQAAEMFAISYTPAEGRRGQAGSGLESGTVARPEATLGAPSTATNVSRAPPMTQPPTMISDAVLDVENSMSIATDIPPSSQIHPSTSCQPNLELQCQDPFRPTVWRGLTSIVRKPQHWQLTSSTPLKTTKIPARFRQHTTTAKKLRASSQKGLDSTKSSLPKGWVYEVEEVSAEVKDKVVDPCRYQMLDAPLTRRKRQLLEIEDTQLQDPYRRHHRASNITEALPTSHSASKTTAVKRWRGISGPISTPPIPL